MEQAALFDPRSYAGVRRPLRQAETLPSWCYRDDAFYQRELDRAFRPSWRLAGRGDEIPASGDYLVVWTAGGSVIVVRGEDGHPRAFANACRHRGAELVCDKGRKGNCKAFVCPYHSWSYRLTGELVGAPGMAAAEGFDKADFGLMPVRLEDWGGFLFVNLDATAPSLAAYLGSMPAFFAGHGFSDLTCVRRVEFLVEANWKLLAENALEAYHTGTVHATTLGQQKAETLETEGNWTGLVVRDEVSVGTLRGEPPPFPVIPTLQGQAKGGAYFTMIYPSTQIACAPDCVWWVDFLPLGPTRSKIILGSCFPRDTVVQPNFDQDVQAYYRRWDEATPEDNEICEVQQRGLAFQDRPPGRLAASEFCVHALDNWVLDKVLD